MHEERGAEGDARRGSGAQGLPFSTCLLSLELREAYGDDKK
jgi:hypothetical protein